jgi:hypothetical protein
VTGEKAIGRIRSTPSRLRVWIVEGHDLHSTFCQRRPGRDDDGVVLVGTRPMGQEDAAFANSFDLSGDRTLTSLDAHGSSHRGTLGDSFAY